MSVIKGSCSQPTLYSRLWHVQATWCRAVACQHSLVIIALRSLSLAGKQTSGSSQMTGICYQVSPQSG